MRNIIITAVIIILLVAASAPVAQAQGAPPPLPALCYGELSINGEPAPVGTRVVAKVDGEVRGELVTEEVGWYGGPGLKSKLAVSGENLIGEMVRFYVSGTYQGTAYSNVFAWEQPYWGSGEVMQINLGIKDIDSTPGADPPEVAVPKPLPPPTAEPDPYPELDENDEPEAEPDSGAEEEESDTESVLAEDEAAADVAEPENEVGTGVLTTGWTVAAALVVAGVIAAMVVGHRIRRRGSRGKIEGED